MFPPFLKIAVFPLKPFVELVDTTKDNISFTGGINSGIVEILSRFYNFKYKLLIPNDREFGVKGEDGNYSGAIGMVNSGEADIGLGPLTLTESRFNVVNFIVYHTDAATIVTKIPKQVPNTYFYMDPFDSTVWLTFAVVLILLSLYYSRFQNKLSYIDSFLRLFCYFIKQISKIKLQNTQQELVIAAWIIFTCVLTLSYSAVLFSFMVVPYYDKGVETFKELADAIYKGSYRCYSYYGSASAEFLKNSFDPSLQYISQKIFKYNWLVDSKSEFPGNIEGITGTNVAITGMRTVIKVVMNSDIIARWFVFKENIAIWQFGIAVRKHFCCTQKLAKSISRLISAGIYQHLFDLEVHRAKVIKYKSYVPDVGDKTITLQHILGVLTLLAAGYVVSCIVLVFEILINMYRKRKVSPRS